MKIMKSLLAIILLFATTLDSARTFDGTGDFLSVDSTPVTAAPLTMCADFKTSNTTADDVLVYIGDKDSSNVNYFRLLTLGSGAEIIWFQVSSPTGNSAGATSTSYSANTWHRACGVEASATSHTAYLDGGGAGTATTSRVPVGADRFSVGLSNDVTGGFDFIGDIANVTVWDVALSATELAILGGPRGMHPTKMRSESIVRYCPLGVASPDPCWDKTGTNLTVTNATVGDNPPSPPMLAGD